MGFKNSSDIMLQEGKGSALICAGLDIIGNITFDSSVYVSIELNITNINNRGANNGMYRITIMSALNLFYFYVDSEMALLQLLFLCSS